MKLNLSSSATFAKQAAGLDPGRRARFESEARILESAVNGVLERPGVSADDALKVLAPAVENTADSSDLHGELKAVLGEALQALRAAGSVVDSPRLTARLEQLAGLDARKLSGEQAPGAESANAVASRQQSNAKGIGWSAAVQPSGVISGRRVLSNDVSVLPEHVAVLMSRVTGLSDDDAFKLDLSLMEMIANGIEHGNLALDFDTKTAAQAKGNWFDVLKAKASEADAAGKHVTVDYRIEPDGDGRKVVFVIKDDGPGFDTSKLPKPSEVTEENQLLLHGRGYFLSASFLDSVKYNAKGNEVTLTKRLPNPAAAEGP